MNPCHSDWGRGCRCPSFQERSACFIDFLTSGTVSTFIIHSSTNSTESWKTITTSSSWHERTWAVISFSPPSVQSCAGFPCTTAAEAHRMPWDFGAWLPLLLLLLSLSLFLGLWEDVWYNFMEWLHYYLKRIEKVEIILPMCLYRLIVPQRQYTDCSFSWQGIHANIRKTGKTCST